MRGIAKQNHKCLILQELGIATPSYMHVRMWWQSCRTAQDPHFRDCNRAVSIAASTRMPIRMWCRFGTACQIRTLFWNTCQILHCHVDSGRSRAISGHVTGQGVSCHAKEEYPRYLTLGHLQRPFLQIHKNGCNFFAFEVKDLPDSGEETLFRRLSDGVKW